MLHGQAAETIDGAIARGVTFVAGAQLPGGGFESLSSTDPADFSAARRYQTTFFPSLILSALSACSDAAAGPVKAKLERFLRAQKSDEWSFNYWDQESPEAASAPYPDDLDDTFAAACAWAAYAAQALDGEAVGQLAKLLLYCETAPGGPYRTWLVPPDAPAQWLDVDLAVNANIARFLHSQGVALPNLTAQLEAAIDSGALHSAYYPGPFAIGYYASHWYRGSKRTKLLRQLRGARVESKQPSPLLDALLLTAVIRLDRPPKEFTALAEALLATQAADGSWPVAAFCIDPHQEGTTAYAGAAALTTALCIEALELYRKRLQTKPVRGNTRGPVPAFYRRVTSRVESKIAALPGAELRDATAKVLGRIRRQDTDRQIVLLPQLVARAAQVTADDSTLEGLASASLWGWMAYTIFDDFLDGEGDAHLLPAAVLCERELLGTLEAVLPQQAPFHAEIASILERLDAANAWEIAHCRGSVADGLLRIPALPDYGDYWQLADRSLGHTIAGLGVLYAAGGDAASTNSLDALRSWFRHYLIARQLNDDLHDWEDDLRRGHINAAGTLILAEWERSDGNSLSRGVPLDDTKQLQLILWQKVAPRVCKDIVTHAAKAREALRRSKAFDQTPLEPFIAQHETAAQEALARRADTIKFIRQLTT